MTQRTVRIDIKHEIEIIDPWKGGNSHGNSKWWESRENPNGKAGLYMGDWQW